MVAVFQKTLESRVQHLKKRNHLVMQLLIIQLPGKSVWVRQGHQHQTSCSEVWIQETMQLRTVCDVYKYR